jgi:hypothetical protein
MFQIYLGRFAKHYIYDEDTNEHILRDGSVAENVDLNTPDSQAYFEKAEANRMMVRILND